MENEKSLVKNNDSIVESKGNNSLSFYFQDLNLNKENLQSPEIEFLIERETITIDQGVEYGNGGIFIDEKTEEMNELLERAGVLKDLPEEERLSGIMAILREKVKFAYPQIVQSLSETNPDVAQWINSKMWKGNDVIPLSELFEKGYGICRHLSVAYLWLAQGAGLQGNILGTNVFDNPIKNILRTDTKDPLFKMTPVGENAPSHVWVEIKLSSGEWIPIDPSVNLIGNTQEGLEMFNLANYRGSAPRDLHIKIEPESSDITGIVESYFEPGVPIAKSKAFISCIKRRALDHKGNLKDSSYTSYQGNAKLIISSVKEKAGSKISFRKI